MQRFDCRGWELPKGHTLGGILYLAQRWQEMLFDYTFDSYRVRTFNLIGLCEEVKNCVTLCELGVLRWIRLQSLRDEVLHGLEHDSLAKKLLTKEYDELIKRLSTWSHDQKRPEQLSYIAHRMIDSLEGEYYREASTDLIRISANEQKKNE